MDKSNNTHPLQEAATLRLLAAALELQHLTSLAANVVPIPGGERVIAIGEPARVAQLLPVPASAEVLRSHAEIQRIGCEMSNVLFNLAQKAGEPLGDHECEAMDKLRKQWDAAYRALKTESQKGGAS